jgi:hypothetical protein
MSNPYQLLTAKEICSSLGVDNKKGDFRGYIETLPLFLFKRTA